MPLTALFVSRSPPAALQVPTTLDADAPTGAAEPVDEEDANGSPARYRRGRGAESRRVIQTTVVAHLVYNARRRSGAGRAVSEQDRRRAVVRWVARGGWGRD